MGTRSSNEMVEARLPSPCSASSSLQRSSSSASGSPLSQASSSLSPGSPASFDASTPRKSASAAGPRVSVTGDRVPPLAPTRNGIRRSGIDKQVPEIYRSAGTPIQALKGLPMRDLMYRPRLPAGGVYPKGIKRPPRLDANAPTPNPVRFHPQPNHLLYQVGKPTTFGPPDHLLYMPNGEPKETLNCRPYRPTDFWGCFSFGQGGHTTPAKSRPTAIWDDRHHVSVSKGNQHVTKSMRNLFDRPTSYSTGMTALTPKQSQRLSERLTQSFEELQGAFTPCGPASTHVVMRCNPIAIGRPEAVQAYFYENRERAAASYDELRTRQETAMLVDLKGTEVMFDPGATTCTPNHPESLPPPRKPRNPVELLAQRFRCVSCNKRLCHGKMNDTICMSCGVRFGHKQIPVLGVDKGGILRMKMLEWLKRHLLGAMTHVGFDSNLPFLPEPGRGLATR